MEKEFEDLLSVKNKLYSRMRIIQNCNQNSSTTLLECLLTYLIRLIGQIENVYQQALHVSNTPHALHLWESRNFYHPIQMWVNLYCDTRSMIKITTEMYSLTLEHKKQSACDSNENEIEEIDHTEQECKHFRNTIL